MEYGYKEIAELLGMPEITVRRRLKNLGIEGVLIDRPNGGRKRVFTEVDVERLKSSDRVLDRVDSQEEGSGTSLSPLDQTTRSPLDRSDQMVLEQLAHTLAVLPDLQALLIQVFEDNQGLKEELGQIQADLSAYQQTVQQQTSEAQKRESAWATKLAEAQEFSKQREESLTTALDSLRAELAASRTAMQRRDEKAQQQEEEAQRQAEELQAKLATAREEAQEQLVSFQQAAQQREAALSAQVQAIQQEIRRPWWQRLRSRKKTS